MTKKFFRLLGMACLMVALPFALLAQTPEARLMRFPAMSADQIVFSYAGDLYTTALNGGLARKLTNHPGYEMFARFSPDGKSIAFTGQYDGNTEIYKIPSQGGVPARLTYTATLQRDDISDRMGPNNITMTWTRDGKGIVYRSRKQTFNDFKGQLFIARPEGGLSEELPLPAGGFCSYSPDGSKLAFNRVFREFRTWKYYQGGMADDIWIYDFKTKQTINITNNKAQDIMPMWFGDEIYFLSDRDRTMNLFAYNLITKQTRKVSNYTEYDIKFPSAGPNGIIFENAGYLHIFDITTQKINKLNIQIADDFGWSRSQIKDASQFMNRIDLSPDGQRLVISARGDIYSVPAKSGITRNLTQSSGAHDRDAVWSPDGKWIAFVSDKSGEFEIWVQKQDGSEPAKQITKNADTYTYQIAWSPDSKKLLFSDKKLRLQYVDVESAKVTLVHKSKLGELNDYDWSPDSRWIVYTEPLPNNFGKVMIYDTQNNKSYAVTDEWYNSRSGTFSRDGKYLFFISDRDFNPIYSQVEWNAAYRDMSRIFMVPLLLTTPNPFAPENNEVSIDSPKAEEKGSESKAVNIDVQGLSDRIVALPVSASNYFNLWALSGKIYYSERSFNGRETSLKMFDLKTKKETELGQGYGFSISFDGKKMMLRKGNRLSVIDLPSSTVKAEEAVDLSGMKVMVDLKLEWEQIYNEAWRQMRDFFYVENMHGVNWPKMKEKYAVLLPYVNNRHDLNYLIGELIGELNVGHAYVNGGDVVQVERVKLGLLGARLSKDKSGYFRIDQILEGQTWSKTLRSPLQDLGINAKEGDYILAIDGKSTKDMADIYSALVGKANRQVMLRINSTPSEEGARNVVVVPIDSEADLYYYNWVQNNIRLVSEATNGEVGYIHIPDMGPDGLNEFMKHFYPQLAKKALIIDDRGNGGGNVSPMILERLNREVQRGNMQRNVEVPGQTPRQMMLGPKVLLINNYSASDGDLFPYGFRKYGLGKIIGVRTWGGVVGIRGSLPFIDGADLRKPEFASYSSEASEWIIEGVGVDPDIVLDNDPAREYQGIDDQLNKAIEVVKEDLKNYKAIPAIPKGPDKTK
jgi:tricorn protease